MFKTHNRAIKIAEDTMEIVKSGEYKTDNGQIRHINELVKNAVNHSKLYGSNEPGETFLDVDLIECPRPTISVTRESTLEAAWRLKDKRPCALNFASAKNPGGGFLRGSLAQEESIARSSALYHTLIIHPKFYEENKRSQDFGYTDHAIYSPDVPVFKNDRGELLEEPYTVSVVTSPAPNRSAMMADVPKTVSEAILAAKIEFVFRKRMRQVLRIMAENGHQTIILGGWGCGVFGNDPDKVAKYFKEALDDHPWFENIVFAIYDAPESDVMRAFSMMFG
jgi:uncharacterized protein (TIGR02452 family)